MARNSLTKSERGFAAGWKPKRLEPITDTLEEGFTTALAANNGKA